MPRAKFLPTPATSTEPPAQEKANDMETSFILPPAAMNCSPPTSPGIQRKRTLSGSTKNKEELPPPPSRARKIIQMKPKEVSSLSTTASSAKTTSPKRKHPTPTSAAGRKIARKTAHSIIERRRRSKMNDEFGVLKDMIPACDGVEMHKLAILQAGIEYVKYLQGCVEKLQGSATASMPEFRRKLEDVEDMEEAGPIGKALPASPELEQYPRRRTSITTISTATTSTHNSPALLPSMSSSSLASQRQLPPPMTKAKTYSTSPPPLVHTPMATGVSPAFSAIHFSPDLSRSYLNQHPQHLDKQSPNILPLPQAAMPVGAVAGHGGQEAHSEAMATAALMMLTNDRRITGSSGRGGGMSVKDLLSN